MSAELLLLLQQQGQPAGQLICEANSMTIFRWQPQLRHPCLTAQILRPSLAGHINNGAHVTVYEAGEVHLICLQQHCQLRGLSNQRPL
jgi:hypothetical protein